MKSVLELITTESYNSYSMRGVAFFAFSFLFFAPCLYLLINQYQTFALMEEANVAYYVRSEGVMGMMSRYYSVLSTSEWNRFHFLSLFWDCLVTWLSPVPRTLRFMRLLEVAALGSLIAHLVFSSVQFTNKWLRILTAIFVSALVIRDMPIAIQYAAIYELEGILLSLLGLVILIGNSRYRSLGLVPLLILLPIKETFVPVGLGISLFVLIREFCRPQVERKKSVLLGSLGLIVLHLVSLIILWNISQNSVGYLDKYSSPFFSLPSLIEWKLRIQLSAQLLISFFILLTFFFTGLGIGLLHSPRLLEGFKKITIGPIGIVVLCLALSEGYRILIYPWIKNDAGSYYYLPCWVFLKIGLALFGIALVNHFFGKHLTSPRFVRTFAAVLLVCIAVLCKQANSELFLRSKQRLELWKLLEVMDQIPARSPSGKITILPVFNEALFRLSQNNRVLRGATEDFDYDVKNSFEEVKTCWNSGACSTVILEGQTTEAETFFNSPNPKATKIQLAQYIVYIKL